MCRTGDYYAKEKQGYFNYFFSYPTDGNCGSLYMRYGNIREADMVSYFSIILAWLIFFPVMMMGKRGIVWSVISISAFDVPYLYVLSVLLNTKAVFSIGAIMALISDIYLWIVFALIKYIGVKKLQTYGIVLLSAIPFLLIMNVALSRLISEPFIDAWDIFIIVLLLIASITLLICGYVKNKLPFRNCVPGA